MAASFAVYGDFGPETGSDLPTGCGRSSGVEHNLAKVGVVSSNLIARSKIKKNVELDPRSAALLSLRAVRVSRRERAHFCAAAFPRQ